MWLFVIASSENYRRIALIWFTCKILQNFGRQFTAVGIEHIITLSVADTLTSAPSGSFVLPFSFSELFEQISTMYWAHQMRTLTTANSVCNVANKMISQRFNITPALTEGNEGRIVTKSTVIWWCVYCVLMEKAFYDNKCFSFSVRSH